MARICLWLVQLHLTNVFIRFFVILYLLLTPAISTMDFKPFSPGVVTIKENDPQLTNIGTSKVDCTSDHQDASNIDDTACVCFVTPSSLPFVVMRLSPSSDSFIYYYGTQKLVAGSTYSVNVECKENNKGPAETRTVFVQVQANQPFVIKNANYPADTKNINAKTSPVYTDVYDVTYQDPENDAISSYMTQSPSHGFFEIGLGDGKIRTLTDLRYATSSTYKLKITATDGYNTINDFVITLNINNLNTAPSISNLPATITVPETTLKSDPPIFTMNVVDPDVYVTPMDPICTPSTPSDMSKFQISGTQISVAYDNALDYEVKTTYLFKCTLFDGFLNSDGLDVLTILVTDVNEPPIWSATEYYCNISEGVVGGASCLLGASLKDPEGDSYTVTLNNIYFSYDLSTNSLLYAKDYDLDTIMASEIAAIMTATDNKGASSTAPVTIHVHDLNDNKCQLDSNLLIYYVTESTNVKQLGSYTMQDPDFTSPNKDIRMDVVGVSPSSTSNYITITQSGDIFYTKLFTTDLSGTTFKTYVRCVDNGSPQMSSTSTVQVVYTAVTTTTASTTTTTTVKTTTTTEKDVWAYTEFKIFFGLLVALIGLLALIVLICVIYYCLKSMCVRPVNKVPVQQIEQYRPQAKRSFPPSEYPSLPRSDPPLNTRWDNVAWKADEVPGSLPADHLYHYH